MKCRIVRKAGSPSAGGFVVEGRRVALENDAVDDNGCPVLLPAPAACPVSRGSIRHSGFRVGQAGSSALISRWTRFVNAVEIGSNSKRLALKNGKGGFVHKMQKIVFDSFWTAAAAFCLTLRRRVHRAVYPQPHRMEKRWRHTWLWNSTGDAVFYPVGQF